MAADKELRGDHGLVADGCQRPANQPLVLTSGVTLRGVVKGAAQVEGLAHQVDRLVVAHPGPVSVAEPHAAEADGRNLQIAVTEFADRSEALASKVRKSAPSATQFPNNPASGILFLFERLDQSLQDIGTERLDQMMIKACLLSTTAIFRPFEACDGRHHWVRCSGLLA